MALIPFSPEYLCVDDALPFGVRDATGRLLLAGGTVIGNLHELAQLRAARLFVDERESEAWRRQMRHTIDTLLRQNQPLKQIAQARPERGGRAEVRDDSLPVQWLRLRTQAETLLSVPEPAVDWLERLRELAQRTRALALRDPDAALYLLVQTAQHDLIQYSRHHALLCAIVCELVAKTLQWPAADVQTAVLAALSMNVAITQLQDQLSLQAAPLTPEQREAVTAHPGRSAALLERAGVRDASWLDAVRHHHDDAAAAQPLDALDTGRRIGWLLHCVDIFTAKLSRRGARDATTPTQAARDACLGPDGRPHDVGAALLKSLGLFPPGTYVRLAGGDSGVVLARGQRADLPLVAVLINRDGAVLTDPLLRDPAQRPSAVECALRPEAVRVRLNDERMLALLARHRRINRLGAQEPRAAGR